MAAMTQPVEAMGRDDQGHFRFDATVHYGGNLFKSLFAVSPDGKVEMLEDEPLAGDVPPELVPRLPDLPPVRMLIMLLKRLGAVGPRGTDILHVLVSMLLEQALAGKAHTRLLTHFNEKLEEGPPLERFAHMVAVAAPVIAIEGALPFIEETVAETVQFQRAGQRQLRLVRPRLDSNDDTRLKVEVPTSGGSVVLIPFHAYRSLVDAERVAHEIAARDVACLIGCERVADLPDSLRQVVDLTLTLPRLDPDLFEQLFQRAMGSAPPDGWREEETHWVTHVHHSDFQHPLGLGLTPEETLT
jgi:hypothetical protein